MKSNILFVLLFASLLVNAVSAASTNSPLSVALADVQCRVAFVSGYTSAITAQFPSLSATLGANNAALQNDLSQLTKLSTAGNESNFAAYVKGTYTLDLKAASTAVKSGITEARTEVTNSTRNATRASLLTIRSQYQALKATLDSCEFTALLHYAVLKVQQTTDDLNNYQAKAESLNSRGINSSNLLDLVDNARSQILTPLQNGVNSATNSSQLRTVLNQYCLYDGCKNGTNFHMAAKFETIRLSNNFVILLKAATNSGLSDQAASVQGLLNSAESSIASLNGGDFTSSVQQKALWAAINSAAQGERSLLAAIKSVTKQTTIKKSIRANLTNSS